MGASGIRKRLFRPSDRQDFVTLYRTLKAEPQVKIVPASAELFGRGVEYFESRPDKEWSLVDCVSFVVMKDEDLLEALTGDHHFEQAGFNRLFK